MGYKQIDGNKSLLIDEKGRVREGLRNLTVDSDRFLYKKDKEGKIQNEWPRIIISHDADGHKDVRLMPEVVMKEHGKLPRSLECSPDDFKAEDGDKTNVSLDNIEYVGEGSLKKKDSSPYKAEEKPESDLAFPNQPFDEADKYEDAADEAERIRQPAPAGEKDSAAKKPAATTERQTTTPRKPVSDLEKGSSGLNAKDAIATIKKYEFGELKDADFLSEDEDRVTVVEAWQSAEKQWKQSG